MEDDSAEMSATATGGKTPTQSPTSLEQMYAALLSHDATVSRHENRLRGQEAAYNRHEQILLEFQQNVSAPGMVSAIHNPTDATLEQNPTG